MPARKPKQLDFGLRRMSRHGGYRPGAGRKKTSKLQSHVARPRFKASEPLHIALKLRDGLPSLRRDDVYRELRRAILETRGLAINHFAILSNHIHLILEAPGQRSLARQMQALAIRLAKALNRIERREGPVFRERYHCHVLRTPAEVRNALAYVLLNERRHRSYGRVRLGLHSSAVLVSDRHWKALIGPRWRRLAGVPLGRDPDESKEIERDVATLVKTPRSWLLRTGWLRTVPSSALL